MPAPRTIAYTPKKEYFSISEVKLILDEPVSSILWWVRVIPLRIKIVGRNVKKFTPENINTLLLFKQLVRKELYTTKGATRVLKKIGELKEVEKQINREEKEILAEYETVAKPEPPPIIQKSFHYKPMP